MKPERRIVLAGGVLLAAAFGAGWLFQRGASQDRDVFLQVRVFQEVMDHLARDYVESVDRRVLYQRAVEAVLEELGDANTSLLSPREAQNFRIRMEGEYGGVGLEVIPREGWVTVVTPLPGGPGMRAGIRTGDQVVEVNGESVEGWEPERVVNALRGPAGTEVSLKVRRPGIEDPLPFTLTREVIRLRSVPFVLTLEGNVGYLPLQSVSETSAREVRSAVDSLWRAGVRRLILDLRGNPGGALDQAVAIADLFLNPGQAVVETRGRTERQGEVFSAREPQPYPDLLVAVLVDERSASASEIVAGALQDHDRAVVVGAPTFGKGSVQTLFPLSGGNLLRLTTGRWFTPLGRSIQKEREAQLAAMEQSTLSLNGDPVARPDTFPRPAYRTEGGREVLGGGGIVPDVLVIPDTLTRQELEALRELERGGGAFSAQVFHFGVEYRRRRPDLPESFSLDRSDLESFRARLEAVGLPLSPAAFRRAERFLRARLEEEIAEQGWGEVGAFRRTMGGDRALREARSLLLGAADTRTLLEMAGEPRRDDWQPKVIRPQEAGEGRLGSEFPPLRRPVPGPEP